MTTPLSADELAREAGVSLEQIEWLIGIGILKPQRSGIFSFVDVFRVKLVASLLNGGSPQSRWSG